MRLEKTFKIEGNEKSFVVKELTVKEIIGLISEDSIGPEPSLAAIQSILSDKFLPLASNVTFEELTELAPSEIKVIWEKFREVNDTFFEVAQKMGLSGMLEKLREAIIADYLKFAVNLSSQATQKS